VRNIEKRLLWRATSTIAAAISVLVTRRVMTILWTRVRGEAPPEGRTVTFVDTMTWAASLGVGVGVARLIAARVSARVWEAVTDEAPPEIL
jgi:uncharacterized protein DUF4235